MTDKQESDAVAGAEKAPPGHHYVTFKDRRILVKSISTAQNMVLGGLLRQMDEERPAVEYLVMLGKLMRLVESLLPDAEDKTWLENGILDGVLNVEDFAVIFLPVASENVAEKKTRRPRRGQ